MQGEFVPIDGLFFPPSVPSQAEAEDSADVAEPLYMIDNARFDLVNSKFALASIANIFMNVTVLEPKFVDDNAVFFHLLKFIMNTLPTLENSGKCTTSSGFFWQPRSLFCNLYATDSGEELVLYGNLSVLGLLVLKNHSRRPKSTDYSIFKFIQAVIRWVSLEAYIYFFMFETLM